MHLKLIACEILCREFCWAIARSPHRVDVEFLPKGLHDIGQKGMRARLKEAIEATDEQDFDALLMGYALCSNGLVGLRARRAPLVIPRAHDCVTLFLGSKERYLEYFQRNPGVYFKTSGWIERGQSLQQLGPLSIQSQSGMNQTYAQLVEKYGEDNAKFLYEELCNMTRNYSKLTFIEMGIEPDDRFERETSREADERGWNYEKLAGNMGLVVDLVEGRWDDERFLVVPPGHEVAASYDEQIVRANPSPQASQGGDVHTLRRADEG